MMFCDIPRFYAETWYNGGMQKFHLPYPPKISLRVNLKAIT